MNNIEAARQLAEGVVVNTPLGRGVVLPDGPLWQPREQKWTCSVRLSDSYVHAFYCESVTPVECEDPSEPWLRDLVYQFLNEPED